MAMMSENEYIRHWLNVATKGGVQAEFSLMADRVRFRCIGAGKR